MDTIENAGEFNLIRRLTSISSPKTHPPVVTGVGDDAAVYRTKPGKVQVISTDAFIERYHFDYAFYSHDQIGYKAMVVNISDIVAMNARPLLATIALGVPGTFSMEHLEMIYKGLTRAAKEFGVQIVGGDTTRAPILMLSVTVVGEADESNIVYRSGAKSGDLICVTGKLGGAAVGLDLLRNLIQATEGKNYLTKRHLRPIPRLDMIEEWEKRGVRPSAMIDISDGLAAEIHHICSASSCGAVLWESELPIDKYIYPETVDLPTAMNYVFNGGDDYELLCIAPEDTIARIPSGKLIRIGRITEKDIVIQRSDGSSVPLLAQGHDHFRS